MTVRVSRRTVLKGGALALVPPVLRSPPVPVDLVLHQWQFERSTPFVHRAVVLAPSNPPEGERLPTLVLFHGLGEAKEGPVPGAFAWFERYGLASCYSRLMHPPIASVIKRQDLREERAREINAELAATPFRGMILVCPFTPNVWSFKSVPLALDALTAFVDELLLPRVAKEFPQADVSPDRTGVDGCSLGGFVSLEVFSRKPARFGTLGVVQPAIGQSSVARYADMIAAARAEHPRLAVHLESSKADPYLPVTKDLAGSLDRRSVPAQLSVPPGPHDQPFLRDVGTLEMLLWHDRALRA
jgi:enterochelin esterase-like enzyme